MQSLLSSLARREDREGFMSAATPVSDSVAPGGAPDVLPTCAAGLGSQWDRGPNPDPAPGRPDEDRRIARLIRRQGLQGDGLIEVLHQVQKLYGYLPKPALLQVARALRLPLSRVYGVASFYHLFRLQVPAAHRCAVCLGTACFVRGGGRLAVGLQRRLGLELDQASRDGRWALERVSCLGACGQAPVMVLDGELFSAPLADQPQALDRWLTALGLPAGLGTT